MEGWTPEYLSPERARLLLLKKFPEKSRATGNEEVCITDKSDVFSLGLTMCFPYDKSHIMLKYVTAGKNITDETQLNTQLTMIFKVRRRSLLGIEVKYVNISYTHIQYSILPV